MKKTGQGILLTIEGLLFGLALKLTYKWIFIGLSFFGWWNIVIVPFLVSTFTYTGILWFGFTIRLSREYYEMHEDGLLDDHFKSAPIVEKLKIIFVANNIIHFILFDHLGRQTICPVLFLAKPNLHELTTDVLKEWYEVSTDDWLWHRGRVARYICRKLHKDDPDHCKKAGRRRD